MERFSRYTMTDATRKYSLIRAMHYVDKYRIEGDFVECGVWRGGSTMIAKACRLSAEPKRNFYLFDTFDGMTEPTALDVNAHDGTTGASALARARKRIRKKRVDEIARATLDEVKENFRKENLLDDSVIFRKGPVEITLIESNLPEKIAVLRLDTDWYESTAIELDKLYPRLVPGGVLIIDDYTTWLGARKAAEEYFERRQMFLIPTGRSGVIGVKPAA